MSVEREDACAELLAFHRGVDRDIERLRSLHARRITCRKGCSACCMDDLEVFEVEAERIARGVGDKLRGERAHERGGCAFLDEHGACRVYADRPYVCRTHGVPLAWIEERDEDFVELRDICHLNEAGGPPVEELEPNEVWRLGLPEEKLRAIQERFASGSRKRVALRELFERLSRDATADDATRGSTS